MTAQAAQATAVPLAVPARKRGLVAQTGARLSVAAACAVDGWRRAAALRRARGAGAHRPGGDLFLGWVEKP